jgi:hypothetical protein
VSPAKNKIKNPKNTTNLIKRRENPGTIKPINRANARHSGRSVTALNLIKEEEVEK